MTKLSRWVWRVGVRRLKRRLHACNQVAARMMRGDRQAALGRVIEWVRAEDASMTEQDPHWERRKTVF